MDISSGTLIVGVICAVVGVALGQFLSRTFVRGDKTEGDVQQIDRRVTKLENDREVQWYKMREHVGEAYATKPQVDALSDKIDNSLGRIERMLIPVFKRLYPDAAVPE